MILKFEEIIMKKIICLLLISVLLIPMSVGIFAHENEYTFVINNEEITITGAFTEEEAYEIAYLHYCMENDIELPCTYGCSHTLETQVVTATTHRARAQQPRCKKSRYNIIRCPKCAYVTTELLSTWYVTCCIE